MTITEFTNLMRGWRFDLDNEKVTQMTIAAVLGANKIKFRKEYHLDEKNIPDFMIDGLCVEVKIKGSKVAIYKQLVRYAEFDEVKQIVLITSKAVRLPLVINNKPAQVIKMGLAWL